MSNLQTDPFRLIVSLYLSFNLHHRSFFYSTMIQLNCHRRLHTPIYTFSSLLTYQLFNIFSSSFHTATARIKGRSPPTEITITTKLDKYQSVCHDGELLQAQQALTRSRTTVNMSIHVVPRSLPEDNNSTIMVVTVSAALVLIVSGLIGYVIFVAKPRSVRNNNVANAGRPVRNGTNPVRTLHYTNGSWERFPQAPISQGYAVQYLRHILQRARAITGRDRAPDNEAQTNGQNGNAGAQQHDNAAGHGQNSGGQGHDSGGHDGIRPATA